MRIYFIVLAIYILFTLAIDSLLFALLKRNNIIAKNKHFKFTYFAIPGIFITLTILSSFMVDKPFVSAQWYWYYTLFNGIYIIIYVPKIILSLFFSITLLSRKGKNTSRGSKMSRAQFLGAIGSIVALIPLSTLIYSLSKGRFNFKIHKVKISTNKLPETMEGLKIIQLSDIHLGNFNFRYHQLDNVISRINALTPDLIFITGDLVNNFAAETYGWEKVFSRLEAKIGKYAVLGNHDYGDYSDWRSEKLKKDNFDRIKKAYHNFGFKILHNTAIDLAKNNIKFSLIGVENWGHHPFPKYGDLHLAMQNPLQEYKILLSHDPDHWDAEVVKHTDIDLTLAGHTHGMQMGLKWKNKEWSPAKWKYKHWGGLYKKGSQYLYVNRGLGVIGMPFRIGMPPEITYIEIN